MLLRANLYMAAMFTWETFFPTLPFEEAMEQSRCSEEDPRTNKPEPTGFLDLRTTSKPEPVTYCVLTSDTPVGKRRSEMGTSIDISTSS
mmetsp:Transcript_44925/g.73218  ORF Transcript_44925/g.73218 Transcript_44925/m.73218 type:complete len:89 (-) Transcript_44925:209-475(-)